jgi:hypothetical protein
MKMEKTHFGAKIVADLLFISGARNRPDISSPSSPMHLFIGGNFSVIVPITFQSASANLNITDFNGLDQALSYTQSWWANCKFLIAAKTAKALR